MTENSSNRSPRDLQTRAAEERKASWRPADLLPNPYPHPDKCYRWVRVATLGQADQMNYQRQRQEGWEPVKASDHPELQFLLKDGNSDSIEVGGLLLCSASKERMAARAEYYSDITRRQIESVNNHLDSQEDPRMRTMFRDHRSNFTKGKGFGPEVRRER